VIGKRTQRGGDFGLPRRWARTRRQRVVHVSSSVTRWEGGLKLEGCRLQTRDLRRRGFRLGGWKCRARVYGRAVSDRFVVILSMVFIVLIALGGFAHLFMTLFPSKAPHERADCDEQ
jgi:hypothetical protein